MHVHPKAFHALFCVSLSSFSVSVLPFLCQSFFRICVSPSFSVSVLLPLSAAAAAMILLLHYCYEVVVVVVVAFPRVRGFWENVRQFIPRLHFF